MSIEELYKRIDTLTRMLKMYNEKDVIVNSSTSAKNIELAENELNNLLNVISKSL
jgi:hypothetical protein